MTLTEAHAHTSGHHYHRVQRHAGVYRESGRKLGVGVWGLGFGVWGVGSRSWGSGLVCGVLGVGSGG